MLEYPRDTERTALSGAEANNCWGCCVSCWCRRRSPTRRSYSSSVDPSEWSCRKRPMMTAVKGNAKRSSELSLRLAESYLSPCSSRRRHGIDTNNSFTVPEELGGGKLWIDASTAFVAPYQTDGDTTSTETRLERIQKAKTAFANSITVEGTDSSRYHRTNTSQNFMCPA